MNTFGFLSHEGEPIKSGGVTLLNDLVQQFKKLNIDTFVFLPNFSEAHIETYPVIRIPFVRNIKSGISSFEIFKLYFFGLSFLKKALARNEITHLYSIFAFPSGFLGALATRSNKIKHIVIVDAIDLPGVKYSPARRNFLLRLIIRYVVRNADEVFVIAGLEKEFKSLAHVKFKSVEVGISSKNQEIRDLQNKISFKILTVCRLVPRKNLECSIRTLKLLRENGIDATLSIVGDGVEMDRLKSLVSDNQLVDKVDFLGSLDTYQLEAIYNAHDVYLFSGFNEGISVALLEAMASGLPIVAQLETAPVTLRHQSKNGLVESWNDDEFALKLATILSNREFYYQCSKSSLAALSELTWESVITNYLPKELS